ncbi:MAG: putative PurR-regulated permease PerM [Natronomonas sp.]
MPDRRRLSVLVGVLVAVVVATAYVLQSVFATVFFAITVAYVLYPARQFLVGRGLGPRVAAAVSTALAFVGVLALVVPLGAALYLRRGVLFAFLGQVPEQLTVAVGQFSYTLEFATLLRTLQDAAGGLAVGLAQRLPALAFKLFLFTLVVYALLVRPARLGETLLRPVPHQYHDVVVAFHERTRSMLYGIYVLQAAVAVATVLVAIVVFLLFGYDSWFTLSVLSGLLQFVPVLGPSLLVLVVGATEVVAGNLTQAVAVVSVGLVVVGFLPDAILRPRLAHITTDVPASLYFIGFTGGTLSVGLVGVVAGPVAVAWLAEAVALLSAETDVGGRDTTVDDLATGSTGNPGTGPATPPEESGDPEASGAVEEPDSD